MASASPSLAHEVREPAWRGLVSSDIGLLALFGAAVVLLHVAVNGQYGFHRDELQTFNNARQLAWGYVEYPPITAVVGRIELELFGTSLRGFRFIPALTQGLVFLLTGLMARTLGAQREWQFVAATGAVIGGGPQFLGGFLSYTSLDYVVWVLVAYFVVRLLASSDPRWWLAIGAAIGVGFLTKYTIAFLVFGVIGGTLLTAQRRHFRCSWFWLGAAAGALIAFPNLLWQIQHHFVTLQYLESIHTRDIRWGSTDFFLLNQLWKTAHPVAVPLWGAGLWYLFAREDGKRYRMLGWMYVLALAGLMAARGRDYYLSPAYPMLIACGAAYVEGRMRSLRIAWQQTVRQTLWWSLATGGVITTALCLPIAPIGTAWWRSANAANGNFHYEIGYRELVQQVAKIRDGLPDSRTDIGILARDDGEAGAVNLYGRELELPRAISGMNSNWMRGYGNPAPNTVIAVGMDPDFLKRNFESCEPAARQTQPFGIQNQALSFYPDLFVCRKLRKSWPDFWSQFRYYG
jgi:4-amino-4-deoxy-L-arabinose transferase-like glycosyltransferase